MGFSIFWRIYGTYFGGGIGSTHFHSPMKIPGGGLAARYPCLFGTYCSLWFDSQVYGLTSRTVL